MVALHVGRTDYCCHPAEHVDAVPSLGGTKRIHFDRLEALRPDLVVSVKEENDRRQIDEIASHWPTLILDPTDVSSAVTGIEILGRAVGAEDPAIEMGRAISTAFANLPNAGGIPVVYLIWRQPFMAAGAGTYLDDVLTRLGFDNTARELDGRYPELDAAWAAARRPHLLLASSEPFPFGETHLPELRAWAPAATPVLVDGELFSWHGARMLLAAAHFCELVPRLAALATRLHHR